MRSWEKWIAEWIYRFSFDKVSNEQVNHRNAYVTINIKYVNFVGSLEISEKTNCFFFVRLTNNCDRYWLVFHNCQFYFSAHLTHRVRMKTRLKRWVDLTALHHSLMAIIIHDACQFRLIFFSLSINKCFGKNRLFCLPMRKTLEGIDQRLSDATLFYCDKNHHTTIRE